MLGKTLKVWRGTAYHSGKPLTAYLSGKPLTASHSGKPLTASHSGKPLTATPHSTQIARCNQGEFSLVDGDDNLHALTKEIPSLCTMKTFSLRIASQTARRSSFSIRHGFSLYFERQDAIEMGQYTVRRYYKTAYRKLITKWKNQTEAKKRMQERRLQKVAERVPPPHQESKLVLHNKAVGISYPPRDEERFCIVQVDRAQFKVQLDTKLVLDCKKHYAVGQVLRLPVLLVGTKTYTVVGRPYVEDDWVEVAVEGIANSEKIIVFKKHRRKQYKKSFGAKVPLAHCRVSAIHHRLKQQQLNKAVALM